MPKKTNPRTNVPTASRFSVLEVSDDSEDEATKPSNTKDAKKVVSSAVGPAKKKKIKKKKQPKTKPSQSNDMEVEASCNDKEPIAKEEGWEMWQNRDEQFVLEQFQKDLQVALEASKVVGPAPPKQVTNELLSTKKKKKDKTISLNEFIGGNSESDVGNYGQANGNMSRFTEDPQIVFGLDNFQDSQSITSGLNVKPVKPKSKKKTQDKSDDLDSGAKLAPKKIIPASNEESIKAEMVHVQEELSKKDQTVTKLQTTIEKQKTWISDLQKELLQVKKRNKQLCHILAQGEMKEKADLLMQIEELNEYREQVIELHAELEQEKSKSSAIKQELIKHQASHSKARHGSTSQ